MKLETSKMITQEKAPPESKSIDLPLGLVGFPDFNKLEIVYSQEELPFLRIHDPNIQGLEFLVLDPTGFVDDYQVEVLDQDLAFLDIKSPDDALILNIANVVNSDTLKITVNLIGPIIINRKTGKGKQVVIGNYQSYTADHILFEEPSKQEENSNQ